MKVALFAAVLLNCDVLVLGPLTTLQAPVPMLGLLAARVAEPVLQMVWLLPAFAAVGTGFTVIVTSEVVAQPEFVIVQRST